MLDPIQIDITNVTCRENGVIIECEWRWGDRAPSEVHVLTGSWPDSAGEARDMVTAWVLEYAEDAFRLGPLKDELMQEGWTVTLGSGRDPFKEGREARIALMERTAGAITRVVGQDAAE